MNTRRIICIFLLLGIIPFSMYSQLWKLRRYEASFSICTSQCYGDIGGSADANNLYGLKDIQILQTRPSFAFGARYKLTGDMAVKMNLIYGFIAGNDKGSRNEERNYSFNSTIFEPSFQFEYYLIPEKRSEGSSALARHKAMVNNFAKIYLYVFGGVGGAMINPKLQDGGGNIVPMDNFSKFNLVIPMGVGLKFSLDSKWSIGFELGRRFTTTDYIDGYSSISSKSNDIYDIGMFSAIYKIPTDRRGRPIIGRATRYRR